MKRQDLVIFILLTAVFFAACQPSQRIVEDSRKDAPPETAETLPEAEEKRDDFTERLESVRTGNFEFLYSFRRRDGEIFTGEDKRFLRANAPRDTNQWVLTTDEKVVIAGSNYVFTPANLEKLTERFEVTDELRRADEKQ